MDTKPHQPFDYDNPEVQRACRAILRLLMGDAGEIETRRTILAVLIAAMGVPMTATSLPS